MHKQQGWRKLENTVKQSYSNTWRASQEVDWSWVSASRVSMLRRSQEKGYQATSDQRQRQNILPGLWRKEMDCCSVVQSNLHFIWEIKGPRVWRKSGEGTESMLLEVQCEVSTVSDELGCHVICWCWSTVFSEVHSQRSHLPGNFRALHASFCWQAFWRCWFHFPAWLAPAHTAKGYQKLVQWP